MRFLKRKNAILMSDFEQNLHKATSNDVTFPNESDLFSIASHAQNPYNSRIAIKHIFKKLQSSQQKWRKVYKALSLIEMMLKMENNMLKKALISNLFVITSLAKTYQRFELLSEREGLITSCYEGSKGSETARSKPKSGKRIWYE